MRIDPYYILAGLATCAMAALYSPEQGCLTALLLLFAKKSIKDDK